MKQLNGLRQSSLFEVNTKRSKTHLIMIAIQKCFSAYLNLFSGLFIFWRKPWNTFIALVLEDKIASAIYEQQQDTRRTEKRLTY